MNVDNYTYVKIREEMFKIMPNCTVIDGSVYNSSTETVLGCRTEDIEAGKHLSFSLRIKIKQ